ncbi:MAG: hypothetical protein C4525_04800 [Desulfarculus sp.]|nr:MAG: hypothetical protein C4525_04800 [Desulfarculus sp.]
MLAGFSWAVFAASRWALVMTTKPDGQVAVLWVWPPWWQTVAIGLGAWLLQFLVALWQRGWLAQQALDRPQAYRRAYRAWWPCLALLLVPLMELCWPLYGFSTAPLALGREAWPLAALAVAAAVLLQTRLAAPELLRRGRSDHRLWLAPLVFLLALGVFAGVGVRLNEVSGQTGYLMAGDEPSYLLGTHSLAVDRDLDLLDNILLRENSYFSDPARLVLGHGTWTPDRSWVSNHRPGLPALLSPFYAWGLYSDLGPRKLATILVWLLGAWMVLEVFWLARFYTGREGPALLSAAAAALALPGLLYSNLLFPEMAAAAFSVAAFRRLRMAQPGQYGMLLLAGVLAAYLAWFHERFILLSVLLAFYALVRGHWRSFGGVMAFFLPCIVSAWLLSTYFSHLYGTPLPDPHIHAQGAYLNPRGAWEGLSGLWVDAGEGLLPYSPIWMAAVAGLIWLLRRRPGDGFWVLLMALATYLTAGLYADWFGGINPPARYLVAAVPFLALGMAAGARWAPRRFMLVTVMLAVLTVAAAAFVMHYPSAVYGHSVVLGQGLQFPLVENLLPAYIFAHQQPALNAQLGLIWLCVAGVVVLALQVDGQRFSPISALICLLGAFLVVAGAATAADRIGPGLTAYRNPAHRIALWERARVFPGEGPSWRVGPAGPQPQEALLELSLPPARYSRFPAKPVSEGAEAVTVPPLAAPKLFLWGQYLNLPPGRYQVTARLSGPYRGPQLVAWLDVSLDKGRQVLTRSQVSGQQLGKPLVLEFDLPRGARHLEVRVGTTGRDRLVLHSLSIVPRLKSARARTP